MLIREPGKNKSGLEKYCTIMMAIDVYWILSVLPLAPVGPSWSASVAAGGRRRLAAWMGQMIVWRDHEPGLLAAGAEAYHLSS